ncbi:DUF6415 family natural product biosynthesis protein [Streptomyces sp. NPDC051662]|uniref:DUF6415 family natural product biosynthesis protein n=1 Tax=Streptomyces sp. NPDC051662 TaxID=3154750 RepID=UPI00342160F7
MAALTPTGPDKVEVLANIDLTLAWNLEGPDLPAVDIALSLIEQFTEYGRTVADELRTLLLGIPADSDAVISARAALGEASRRLHLPPPSSTPHAAGQRAQNLARLVQGLVRAAGRVAEEQARVRRPRPTPWGSRLPARSTTCPPDGA